jgi:hypothetical protein
LRAQIASLDFNSGNKSISKKKITAAKNRRKSAKKTSAATAQIHLKKQQIAQLPRLKQVATLELLEKNCCQTTDIFLFSSSIAPCGARADVIPPGGAQCRKQKTKQLTTNNIGGTR